MSGPAQDATDLFIIGGGVNGCGIARDAVGRGLSVSLAEMGDLASATSSASTKLYHGGLRYLEFYEFRLVREALIERETLLRAMPHISWPMRFVLPTHKDMRPAWLIRLGLFIYDHLGGRKILPGTRTIDLRKDEAGRPLKPFLTKAFEYSDCWVEDSRLVSLNARDARRLGAEVMTRTKVVSADRRDDHWEIVCLDVESGEEFTRRARMLVNAGGPWVEQVVRGVARINTSEHVRLVRGSHIVTKRLFDHDRCYFFQGGDGRICFAIPYEGDFTLIGTTDKDHHDNPADARCTPEEADYLRALASEYFETPIQPEDVVWTYSGVRPLYDDGAKTATAATRDYVLSLDRNGPPILSVFGGKITTHRRLAESALERVGEVMAVPKGPWTAGAPLPGGDFPHDGVPRLIEELRKAHPWLTDFHARRLVRAYGTEAAELLSGASSFDDLGEDFGATMTEREVVWLMENEFARTAEDVVWRRTRLGLRLTEAQIARLDDWMRDRRGALRRAAE